LFGCIAALFAAVGYWNISPERFLDNLSQVDDSAIDWYATNAHSLQFLPGRQGAVRNDVRQGRAPESERSHPGHQPDLNMFRGTDFPWHVTRATRRGQPGRHQVELIVRVQRTDEKNREP
jgi:lipopolysaccharide export system protein LptC